MAIHQIFSLSSGEDTRITPRGTHSGMDITIQNINDSGYVYIGGEGVTEENFGFRLMPNHSWSIELPGIDSLYAIAENDGAKIAILRTNLESKG
jgi:hypothetical protein